MWVHWIVARSCMHMRNFRSIYMLSSIPTERRNQHLKIRLKTAMRGWTLTKPRLSRRRMAHVLNREVVEVGLMARKAGEGRGAHVFVTKKRNMAKQ